MTVMSVGGGGCDIDECRGSGCDGDEYSGRWVRAKIVR